MPPVENPAPRREWLGLAVLMLPTVLLALDMTVLHLAAPHLSADLQPTSAELLWILDIYGFMIAGFLVTIFSTGVMVSPGPANAKGHSDPKSSTRLEVNSALSQSAG